MGLVLHLHYGGFMVSVREIREKMDSLALQMTECGIAKNKTTDIVEMNKYNMEMNKLSGQIEILKWVLSEQRDK